MFQNASFSGELYLILTMKAAEMIFRDQGESEINKCAEDLLEKTL